MPDFIYGLFFQLLDYCVKVNAPTETRVTHEYQVVLCVSAQSRVRGVIVVLVLDHSIIHTV